MAPPDKPNVTKTPVPNPTKHEKSPSEVESRGHKPSQELEPRLGVLAGYLSEEKMERFGREARSFADQGKAKAGKFVQEDLRDLAKWAEGTRRDVKVELKKQVEEMGPKAKQLGTNVGARLEHAQAEADKLAVTSKIHRERVKQFLKKYRMAILVGLISLIFVATGHPDYILYTLLHLVMIVFAAAHTIIGILSIIFDNLFRIELFSSIGYALYNVTYAFYAPAFSVTDSVVIWLQWIHIFT
jgi:hypothetical protein